MPPGGRKATEPVADWRPEGAVVTTRLRRPRVPAVIAFLAAAVVYVIACFFAALATEGPLQFLESLEIENHWFQGLVGVLLILFVFVAPYVVARTMYFRFRWKFIDVPGRWCVACGYNLTGNSSGVCPECGTALQESAVESN